MRYFTYITATCREDAKTHSQLPIIERLAVTLEEIQTTDLLNDHGEFKKKDLGRSFRLVIGLAYDGDDCMLVFLRVYAKGSSEYIKFCADSNSLSEDLRKFCHSPECAAVWSQKRAVPDVPQLSDLTNEERNCLYLPLTDHGGDWLVLESSEWVSRVNREDGQFHSYISSLYDLVLRVLQDISATCYDSNGTAGILFRRLSHEQVLFLVAPVKPGDEADIGRLKAEFSRELDNEVERERLLRRSRRAYPGLVLGDAELWIHGVQGASEKANLALSNEEAAILSSRAEGYPLFINGRPGSGKSTVLQYLFAEHLYYHLTNGDQSVGTPLYLTYNKELLDIAKDNVGRILKSNAYNLLRNNGHSHDDVETMLDKSFVDFRDFLSSLLPLEKRFDSSKYVGLPEFRIEFDKKILRHPDKPIRSITAELAWHVIRTYIKGVLAEQYAYLDPDGYREWPANQKSVTDETFAAVYLHVWEGWYKAYCEQEGFWDDQDLTRRLLEEQDVAELARHPVVFCDEAQDFTKNELRLIYRLSLFSRRNLTPDVLNRIPFAFAGDPFQTLNPTGFDWESTRTVFYQTIIEQLDKRKKGMLEFHFCELSFNYRSTQAVVKLCNFIHLLRGLAFGRKHLQPQQTYFDEAANMPVYFDVDSPVLQSKLDEQKEIVIIVPCEEGEEEKYIKQDKLLSRLAFSPDGAQVIRNVLSPMRAKGQEFSRVVVYKFGDACRRDYHELLQLLDPMGQPARLNREQVIPAEYFVNRLYVAASRAEKRLFIADTAVGLKEFWGFFERHDPALFVEKYKQTVEQPGPGANFTWSASHLIKIQPGGADSWDSDHDNPLYLAEEFLRSGLRLNDRYKLRLAAQNFQAAGKPNRKLECEAILLEWDREWTKAAEYFLQLDKREKALQLFWKGEAFDKICEVAENTLERRASALMLAAESEPQDEMAAFLTDVIGAIRNGSIQPDGVWAKVIATMFRRYVDHKSEAALQPYAWGNLVKLLDDYRALGLFSKADERVLEQLRLRAAPYPDKLDLMQTMGVEPSQIVECYVANQGRPLAEPHVEVVFQALQKQRKYDELVTLVSAYPSTKRQGTLLASCLRDNQQQRLIPLVQQIFTLLCDHGEWNSALDFASKGVLPLDEPHAETIRKHPWGIQLHVQLIKVLATSAALAAAEDPTKNMVSKYLKTRLIDSPAPFCQELTVAQAGAALERANWITDCLEFYESVYKKKAWPASDKDLRLARERWLVCKRRQIELQKEPARKEKIRREIRDKRLEWKVESFESLPEFPPAAMSDMPQIVAPAKTPAKVGQKKPNTSDSPEAPDMETFMAQVEEHLEEIVNQLQSPRSHDVGPEITAPFELEVKTAERRTFQCKINRQKGKITIFHNADEESVTILAKKFTLDGSDSDFEEGIEERVYAEDSARYFVSPWNLTCNLRRVGQSVHVDLYVGDIPGDDLFSVRIS